jgi:hypothetical protein
MGGGHTGVVLPKPLHGGFREELTSFGLDLEERCNRSPRAAVNPEKVSPCVCQQVYGSGWTFKESILRKERVEYGAAPPGGWGSNRRLHSNSSILLKSKRLNLLPNFFALDFLEPIR